MKKIAFHITSNKAHFPHMEGLIKELLGKKNIELIVFYANQSDIETLGELGSSSLIKKEKLVRLSFSYDSFFWLRLIRGIKRLLLKLIKGVYTLDVHLLYLNNHKKIKNIDAIIFSDSITGNIFKKINPNIKVIWTLHGPSLNDTFPRGREPLGVDLVLSPGETTTNSFQNAKCKTAQVGSIKLTSRINFSNSKQLFENNNKVILFNPHFNETIGATAWKDFGEDIFEFFKDNPIFNLIFAPHPNWKLVYNHDFLEAYKDCPNIRIDIDSDKLTNLYYEPFSDIYVGDVSSQVFEYIFLKPRKTLFLDKGLDSKKHIVNQKQKINVQKAGKIVSSLKEFIFEVETGFDSKTRDFQMSYVSTIFDNTDKTPSKLAADEVLNIIGKEKNEKKSLYS